MRGAVAIACVVLAACAGPRAPRTPRASLTTGGARCLLRISPRGTFVDGERVGRGAAIARCKRAPGGAVVVIEQPGPRWETASASMVEDPAILAAWDQTRSALAREGVRIYVQGPICHDPRRLGCRPQQPPVPAPARERTPVAAPPPRP